MFFKWSYSLKYNNSGSSNIDIIPRNFNEKHSFKVFRKTIKFKKYTKGLITKVAKKFYIRRKRKTSNYNLIFIPVGWVKLFIRTKQLTRFTQSINMSKYTLTIPEINFSLDQITIQNISLNLSTFTNFFLKKFFKNTFKAILPYTLLLNNFCPIEPALVPKLWLNLLTYEGQNYPIFLNNEFLKFKMLFFKVMLNPFVVRARKILILITCLSTFNKNYNLC